MYVTLSLDEGLQARNYKDSLTDVLVPQILSSWLEAVARTANEIRGEPVVKYEKGGYCGKIVATTKKGKECLIKAIDRHMGDAPEVARQMLASYRSEMQKDLSG
ncbi:hypothetical protein [Candidatus Nitrososphaera sp. FF02]|uniref:hypothetical protein n=1 Tax=Candidatus Nitrososphaera sp. FF02 TaxID=3398226 RepID=UPI0039EBA8CF